MKHVHALPVAALLAIMSAHAFARQTQVPATTQTTSSGTTLLVNRAKAVPADAPARGQTSAQVQARYGEPQQKLAPEGGQKKQWPTINRWLYPRFTVYFEKDKVIDVVANRASSGEVGPEPVAATEHAHPAPRHLAKKKHLAAKPAKQPTVDVTTTAPASASQPAH